MKIICLILLLMITGCADKRSTDNPPVSLPGGGTLNAPPSDGIKIPGK